MTDLWKKKALVLAADGTEESELVITADVLRRAGVEVTICGVNGPDPIKCSRKVVIVPDCSLESVQDNLYDAIILPGGYEGTEQFCKSELVAKIVKKHDTNLKFICAICAAPLALKVFGICNYKTLTSHPSVKNLLTTDTSFQYKEERVVRDENLITSRAPGTAFEFALAISEALVGKKDISSVSSPLLLSQDDCSQASKKN